MVQDQDLVISSLVSISNAIISVPIVFAVYKLDSNPRGIAVIVANPDYAVSPLPGCRADAEIMDKIFRQMKFRTVVNINLTASQIVQLAQVCQIMYFSEVFF